LLPPHIGGREARDKVANVAQGSMFVTSEYQDDKLAGCHQYPAIEIRMPLAARQGERYVLYCQSGRRSAAAAFLLAQARGTRVPA